MIGGSSSRVEHCGKAGERFGYDAIAANSLLLFAATMGTRESQSYSIRKYHVGIFIGSQALHW